MAARFADFMLGITVIVYQCVVAGGLGLFLASRASRAARVVGGLFIILFAWMSFVGIRDRVAGHQPRPGSSNLDLAIYVALVIGWIAGHNRRVRAAGARLLRRLAQASQPNV
jgi:hypothetical protein